MKLLKVLLDEYSESHRHETNIIIHWICVPLIFWSITGMLFLITVPLFGNLAIPSLLLLSIYYFSLSRTLFLGMLLFELICLIVSFMVYAKFYNLAITIYLSVFLLAWIAQFASHKIEGRKPAFLRDVQFLLIGPAWLMIKLFKKSGIPY